VTKKTPAERIPGLQRFLKKNKVSAFLITNLTNIRYLSGFTGTTAFMIVTGKDSLFLTDFRYTTQAKKQVHSSKIFEIKSMLKGISDACKSLRIKNLAVESTNLQLAHFNNLRKELSGINLISSAGIVEKLRLVKDEKELKLIKKAINISAKAIKETIPLIKEGVAERDIALELEFRMRRLGAEKNAFDIIVASGHRSSMPHAVAGRKKIKNGDLITIDFGCVFNGYNSDITRTYCLGQACSKEKKTFELVLASQKVAFDNIKEGMLSADADKTVRDFFARQNVARFFGHGLGHGVGLDIHENPALSPNTNETLTEGMVFTIEPGLYFAKKHGVRIEDMATIKNGKLQILTKSIDKVFEI